MNIEEMKLTLEVLEDLPNVGSFASLLKKDKAIETLRAALAQQPATGAPVKAERDQLRCTQANAVMPLIGPLLDAWENADREVISHEPELSRQLKAINNAMEGAQPATPEPVYQIRKAFTQDAEWAWRDATEEAFHMHPEKHRRILYTHPAPSVPDAAIDSAIYNQCPDFDDWHEGPSIDDIKAIVRVAIQQAESQQPAKGERHWEAHRLIDTLRTDANGGRAATVHDLDAAADLIETSLLATPNVDVRTILLAIVPGDGNGEEVYAESVDDVVAKMTELSEREESLRTQVDLLTAAVEARGREIAKLKATGEPVMDVRCEGCGYMTHHREHMGCVRAAKQHTHPAPSVFLVRDVASLLGASVPDVCNALAELGYEPRRSTNAAISPDEAIAVAKRINPAPSVPDDVVRDAERFRRLNLTEEAIAVVDSMLARTERQP